MDTLSVFILRSSQPRLVLTADHVLLSGFHKLNDVRDGDESSGKDALVTRFGEVNGLAAHDNVDAAGHTSGGDVLGMLLNTELLPVHERRLLVDELEGGSAGGHAVVSAAFDGRSVFELLYDVLVDEAALDALEGAKVELWLHFGGSGDSAGELDQLADDGRLELSQFD